MYKIQVYSSLLFKFIALIISFYSIRIQLDLLSASDYATWAVVFNVINWILIIDFGIGNSIRNKLTFLFYKKKYRLVSVLIGRAYTLSIFTALSFLLLFIFLLKFNIVEFSNAEIILILFFIITFCLLPINQICHALNNSQIVILIQLLISILSVLILSYYQFSINKMTLVDMSYIYGGSTLFSYVLVSIIYFKLRGHIGISFDCKFKRIFPLVKPGLVFFALQVFSLVIFATDRLILSNIGTTYNILYYDIISRYFNIFVVFSVIMNTPVWSLVRKFATSGESQILSLFFKRIVIIQSASILILVFMSLMAPFIFKVWLGNNGDIASISASYIVAIAFLSWSYSLYSSCANISNGLGVLKPQLIIGAFCCVLKVPLAVIFSDLIKDPFLGVSISTIVCLLPFPIYFFVFNKKGLII